jgi:putative heme-binding domain-containing protein
VKFGTRSRFPPRYRRALFILDWAYGRIFAVHLSPRGASYDCQAELFLKGRPLNVTDLDFGPDGAMYFVVGGRRTQSALYRVKYVGPDEPEAPPTSDDSRRLAQAAQARRVRKRLATFHGAANELAVETAWPHLDSGDAFIRHAARIAIEHQPPKAWQERALAETRPRAALVAMMALARVGGPALRARVLDRLESFSLFGHDEASGQAGEANGPASRSRSADDAAKRELQLLALRATALVFIRLGRPTPQEAERIADRLGPAFPSTNAEVNRELSELLVYLDARDIVAKTLALIPAAKTQEERLHYLFVLRHARRGWTSQSRRAYFEWLSRPEAFAGAHYMPLFLKNIRNDALAALDPRERESLAPWLESLDRRPARAPLVDPSRSLVWDWKMADLADSLSMAAGGRDYERGRKLFSEAACARCHRLAGAGTPIGPDLDGVAARFGLRDLLETIIAPSKFVDEKYRDALIETVDGEVLTGRVLGDDGSAVLIATDPLDPNRIESVDIQRIQSRTASLVSPMPGGLLNTLSRDEIFDLLAYIVAGGASGK